VAVPDLIQRFVLPLETLGVRYMVTGSVAAMDYGEPRLTNDVDVVVELPAGGAQRFVRAFEVDEGLYVPPEDVIVEALAQGSGASFNVISPADATKADYFVATDDLAQWGLAHRRREAVGDAVVWVAPPEYVIVRKLQYHRAGGSGKHLDDIRSMLLYGADRLDLGIVEDHVARLGLDAEWRLARGARPTGSG
jgi:hypothetical protein